jgi:hypothetical protein
MSYLQHAVLLPIDKLKKYVIISLLIPWNRDPLENLAGFQVVKKFPAFIEPLGSLLHSQVSATGVYPEPARSSLGPHVPIPEDTS